MAKSSATTVEQPHLGQPPRYEKKSSQHDGPLGDGTSLINNACQYVAM